MKISFPLVFFSFLYSCFLPSAFAQDGQAPIEEKSLQEVIQGIDALLDDIEKSSASPAVQSPSVSDSPLYGPADIPGQPSPQTPTGAGDKSFRLKDELLPGNLLNQGSEPSADSTLQPYNKDDVNPPSADSSQGADPVGTSGSFRPQATLPLEKVDYDQASLEDLLRESMCWSCPNSQARSRFLRPTPSHLRKPYLRLQRIRGNPWRSWNRTSSIKGPILAIPRRLGSIPFSATVLTRSSRAR